MREFERLSKISPRKKSKFNLDRELKLPKKKIKDIGLLRKIKESIKDFEKDGATYAFSTFKIITSLLMLEWMIKKLPM